MNPVRWLQGHDLGLLALRRAGRTAILMPAMFAIGDKVIGNATIATFAAFGTFAMLLLVDFGGPMRDRLQAQAALGVAGAVLVAIGTLASRSPWLAALSMGAVGFAVLFAGVVSSVLAGAAPSLLLAFILPAATKAPAGAIPDRVAGWAVAAAVACIAVAVMWPAPTRDRLRAAAIDACVALAERLRSDVELRIALDAGDEPTRAGHLEAVVAANAAVSALHRTFLATPYRPTGLSTPGRTLVRLVDELNWLNRVVMKATPHHTTIRVDPAALEVKRAAADILDEGAALLARQGGADSAITASVARLRAALSALERSASTCLPVQRESAVGAPDGDRRVAEIVSSLDPGFRAQELSFVVSQIAANISATAWAERRSWSARVAGRQPDGLPTAFSAAQQRATAHLERHSVWLHNSVRAAIGLAAAIFVANLTGVQHSFWVVLGTLSVLRSNALNTGQNAVRGLVGTATGVAVGAALLKIVGTNATVLWLLLPVAILIAGVAPATISFAAGQAAFTLTLVILFNIIAPTGWEIGLVRVEDIGIGCAVSLAVGLLFWPRGAAAALRIALAEAYLGSAHYLGAAVEFGVGRCDNSVATGRAAPPVADSAQAAAAARRLDDTFRSYLAERGAKPVPLPEIIGLVSGVASLRLAADAVLDLWQSDAATDQGDRAAVRRELLDSVACIQSWYAGLATSLTAGVELPAPAARDEAADARLIDAVRHDLQDERGRSTGTAVRVIWTGDHLDAVRQLQLALVEPARTAITLRGLSTRSRGLDQRAALPEGDRARPRRRAVTSSCSGRNQPDTQCDVH